MRVFHQSSLPDSNVRSDLMQIFMMIIKKYSSDRLAFLTATHVIFSRNNHKSLLYINHKANDDLILWKTSISCGININVMHEHNEQNVRTSEWRLSSTGASYGRVNEEWRAELSTFSSETTVTSCFPFKSPFELIASHGELNWYSSHGHVSIVNDGIKARCDDSFNSFKKWCECRENHFFNFSEKQGLYEG